MVHTLREDQRFSLTKELEQQYAYKYGALAFAEHSFSTTGGRYAPLNVRRSFDSVIHAMEESRRAERLNQLSLKHGKRCDQLAEKITRLVDDHVRKVERREAEMNSRTEEINALRQREAVAEQELDSVRFSSTEALIGPHNLTAHRKLREDSQMFRRQSESVRAQRSETRSPDGEHPRRSWE